MWEYGFVTLSPEYIFARLCYYIICMHIHDTHTHTHTHTTSTITQLIKIFRMFSSAISPAHKPERTIMAQRVSPLVIFFLAHIQYNATTITQMCWISHPGRIIFILLYISSLLWKRNKIRHEGPEKRHGSNLSARRECGYLWPNYFLPLHNTW
jgi:hypothetical protein